MPPVETAATFLNLLEQSGLLPPDQIAPLRGYDPPGPADKPVPQRLAADLIRQGLLTPVQAKHLLLGRFRGFFITDKYKILDRLGTGGMGVVFLCEHLILRRLVAVKVLSEAAGGSPLPPGAVERFYREARAVAALDHQNIVRVFDVDIARGQPYMVMEYVDGTDLHKLTTTQGRLALPAAVEYVRQTATGLQHAHEAGLVHRDIKPGNILVERAGGVKILDLGLARFLTDTHRNENLTERYNENAILGTADFISPEQIHRTTETDIRSDIYSLGCTFYFLLAGRGLFDDGTATQKLIWHQGRSPTAITVLRPDVPPELGAVLQKMIAKRPEDRYQTPAEVAAALRPFGGEPVPPPPAGLMPKTPPAAYRLGVSRRPVPGSSLYLSPPDAAGRSDTRPAAATGNRTDRPAGWATPRPAAGSSDYLSPLAPPTVPGLTAPPARPAKAPAVAGTPGEPVPVSGWSSQRGGSRGRPSPAPASTWSTRRIALHGGGLMLAAAVVAFATYRALLPAAPEGAPAVPGTVGDPAVPGAADAAGPMKPALTGGGSTFVAPLMAYWADRYQQKTGTRLAYQGVGSGKGLEGVKDGTFAFGCTDAPMKDAEIKQLQAAGREVLHIPLAMGAVVPTYNLPDVSARLRFTGGLLADIYLGKVTRWNDPVVQTNNPGVRLPDRPIHVVYRSDASGTTFIWTDYLSKVSGTWAERKIGPATTVTWPAGVGTGATKSDGLTEVVTRTPGAIGYVELSHAIANSLPFGEVRNKEGNYVVPSLESVTAAAAGTIMGVQAEEFRLPLTDAPGEASYPISGMTWAVLIFPVKERPAPEAIEFLEWATHDGQEYAPGLRFAPLPDNLKVRLDATFYRLKRKS